MSSLCGGSSTKSVRGQSSKPQHPQNGSKWDERPQLDHRHRSSVTRLNLDSESATFYTMEQLTSGEVESCIDPTRRELYLSNTDFMQYFKITKGEFLLQPKWKQVSQKKKFRLF